MSNQKKNEPADGVFDPSVVGGKKDTKGASQPKGARPEKPKNSLGREMKVGLGVIGALLIIFVAVLIHRLTSSPSDEVAGTDAASKVVTSGEKKDKSSDTPKPTVLSVKGGSGSKLAPWNSTTPSDATARRSNVTPAYGNVPVGGAGNRDKGAGAPVGYGSVAAASDEEATNGQSSAFPPSAAADELRAGSVQLRHETRDTRQETSETRHGESATVVSVQADDAAHADEQAWIGDTSSINGQTANDDQEPARSDPFGLRVGTAEAGNVTDPFQRPGGTVMGGARGAPPAAAALDEDEENASPTSAASAFEKSNDGFLTAERAAAATKGNALTPVQGVQLQPTPGGKSAQEPGRLEPGRADWGNVGGQASAAGQTNRSPAAAMTTSDAEERAWGAASRDEIKPRTNADATAAVAGSDHRGTSGAVFRSPRTAAGSSVQPPRVDAAHRRQSPTANASTVRQGTPEGTKYIVRANDTYWTISQQMFQTGGFFKAIYEHNRRYLSNPDRLSPGVELYVPDEATLVELYPNLCPKRRTSGGAQRASHTSGAARSAGKAYTVAEGDTLFEIARRELGKATRWAEIYELNRDVLGEEIDSLEPGTTLILPSDAGERSAAVKASTASPALNVFGR